MQRLAAVAIGALAAAGAGAASAQAATLSGFRVVDAGSSIRYTVDVCTASSAELEFTASLRQGRNRGAAYPTHWTVTQREGCHTWKLDAPDMYPKGSWSAQLRVVVHRRAYRTPVRGLRLT
jgi:hypothetical protein